METCDDQVANGDETKADCGGSCDPCIATQSCSPGADCVSQLSPRVVSSVAVPVPTLCSARR